MVLKTTPRMLLVLQWTYEYFDGTRYNKYLIELFLKSIAYFKERNFLIIIIGDIIFVNTNWWYHSTNVEQDLSITITNEYI